MFKKAGVFDEKKILGITNLGAVRTNSFIAKEKVNFVGKKNRVKNNLNFCTKNKGLDSSTVNCPVIGGHSGVTIVPVISQCNPSVDLISSKQQLIVLRVRVKPSSLFLPISSYFSS